MDKYIKEGFNLKLLLKQFAVENMVNEASLDYRLISYKTFTLRDDSLKDSITFADFDEDSLETINIDNLQNYINFPQRIVQRYTIEIFRRQNSLYPILINLQANEDSTMLKALIDTKRIPDAENLSEVIKTTILNICAYRGIIINLGWSDFDFKVKEIATKLQSLDSHPQFYEIDIASLPQPKILNISVTKVISNTNGVKSLSHNSILLNGGFFKVEVDEKLLEYQKPTYKSTWRNIYGEIYGINTSYPIGISAADGVRVADMGQSVCYYSTQSGYISIVNNAMQISNIVTLDSVNVKNIQNIQEQSLDTLIVKNDNLTRDVITSGVDLKLKNLKVIGNIGAVNIECENLFAKGQVHIKSNIVAQNASILHFKGNLKCHKAKIRYCENANVQSDDFSANHINGSKVFLNKGKIFQVRSGNTFYVQDELIIDKVVGNNNEFILHPCLYGKSKSMLDDLNAKSNNIRMLQETFNEFGYRREIEYKSSDLLYNELLSKNKSHFDENYYNWDKLLSIHKIILSQNKILLDRYNELLDGFSDKISLINSDINDLLKKMFDIKVIFNETCKLDFYVRIMNTQGVENRYHVNTQKSDIKMIKLESINGEVKIACYRE